MENNKPITLGGMSFDERSLFTNLIAFGAIGAGKTASVVYPMLSQICNRYNQEDVNSPAAKFGGLVLDVKGDFHEALIYSLEQSGRDVLKDLVVVRPDNDYHIVEFEDIATKDRFFVSASGGIVSKECDKVLNQATGPADIIKRDATGRNVLILANGYQESLSSSLFEEHQRFLKEEIHADLKQLEFDVTGLSIRWLGWREEDGHLVRVACTKNKVTQFAHSTAGVRIVNNKPSKLKYVGVHALNNGLTYNLVSKTSASTEVADRLMAVAEVTGNSLGGDNAYWSNASKKHIAACVELFRQVEGPMGRECSVNEIQRFTTDDVFLQGYIGRLDGVIKGKQSKGVIEYEILLLRTLEDYFTKEWLKHDPKTRSVIMSCITNLFGDVTRNPQLIKTFCQPSRFFFEDCLNDGKIYTLVLNAYPNAQQLLGTCMKLDFQQTVLKRTQASSVNKSRFLLFLADEYQFFLTTAGGGQTGGDDKFLSVSRQSRIFNLICLQAVTSLLAVQKDECKINSFLQCFGSRVFLQNHDEKTNKLADQTLGQFWAEKVDFSGPDLKFSSAFGGEGKHVIPSRHQVKHHRYEASAFTQFPPFKAVLFNKERPPGRQTIEADLKDTAKFWNKDMLADAANRYYQAYLENRAFELGVSHLFNTRKNSNSTASQATQSLQELQTRKEGTLQSWVNGVAFQPADTITHSPIQEAPDVFFNDPIQPEAAGSPPENNPPSPPTTTPDGNPRRLLWLLLICLLGTCLYLSNRKPPMPATQNNPITIIYSPNLGGPSPVELAQQMVLAISHVQPDTCLFVGHRFLKREVVEYLSAISKSCDVRILLGSYNGTSLLEDKESPLRQFYFTQLVSSTQPINTQVLIALNRHTQQAVCYIGTFPFDLATAEHSEYSLLEMRDYSKCEELYQKYSKLLPVQSAEHTLQ